MGLGCVVAGRSWIMGLAFAVFFPLVYWPVMKREAQFLRGEFPQAFDTYAKQVPLFFPKWARNRGESERFQWRLYRKNREYEAAIGYVTGMLLLALKLWLR